MTGCRSFAAALALIALIAAMLASSPAPAAAQSGGICDRTEAVQTAIIAALSAGETCSTVDSTDLASITGNLDLQAQGLTALQAGDFAGLSGVTGLLLAANSLTALPSLSSLTSLILLHLNANDLTSLPDLSSLTALQHLYAGGNQLTALPDLSANTALTRVWVPDNNLTSLERLQPHLGDLTAVGVGWNRISTLPAGFLTSLPAALSWLDVDGMRLSEAELTTIETRFTGLRILDAGGTGLTRERAKELIDDLPTTVEYLGLDGNDLRGMDWTILSQLSSLSALVVSGANLEDSDAAAITTNVATSLTTLYADWNKLTAVPSLSRLTALTLLSLRSNDIGEPPSGAFSGPSNVRVWITHGNDKIARTEAQLGAAFTNATFFPTVAPLEAPAPTVAVTKAVSGNAPAGVRYAFAYDCDGWSREFTLREGESRILPTRPRLAGYLNYRGAYRVVQPGSCTLREPGSHGATRVEGLFANRTIAASTSVTVTNEFVPPWLIIHGPAAATIAEEGETAVAAYTATGPGAASAAWSLSGADAALFAIDDAGALAFLEPPDFEQPRDQDGASPGDNVYVVTVNADGGGAHGALTVRVTVSDVAEPDGSVDPDPPDSGADSEPPDSSADPGSAGFSVAPGPRGLTATTFTGTLAELTEALVAECGARAVAWSGAAEGEPFEALIPASKVAIVNAAFKARHADGLSAAPLFVGGCGGG